MFWGCKIKKCLHASLPVYVSVSLSSGDNHAASLVFLLLISVRRRMAAECQLSLKHLFPANNSLRRCLVLVEGSPIASSLLTQNNNADECHLLVLLFSIVFLRHHVSSPEKVFAAAVPRSPVIGRGMHSGLRFFCGRQRGVTCWTGWRWRPPGRRAGGSNPGLGVAADRRAWTAVWNVGRAATEVEVTSSHSFLFICLFPEFHCYYSNNLSCHRRLIIQTPVWAKC